MPDIAGIAIAMDVVRPFMLGSVGVASPHVARLELFELLLGAELISLAQVLVSGHVERGKDEKVPFVNL